MSLAVRLTACLALACAAIMTPSGPAKAADGRAMYTNPIVDHDFADPMVTSAADGYFYAYGTQTVVNGKMVNIVCSRSRDMVHWETLGEAMPQKPAWAKTTQNFWAPHVVDAYHHYIMYYAAEPDNHQGMAIGVAVATKPSGPFVPTRKFLIQSPGFQAIDPMAFIDSHTFKKYLYWGSGFAPIHVQELSDDWLSFKPGSHAIDVIQPHEGPNENLVEGVWVREHAGYFYLFYSGDDCCGKKPNYAVMVARAKSPTGPFIKLAKATGRKDSIILRANARWWAPGHNATITDADGQDWIIYHAIDPSRRFIPGTTNVRRPLMMDPIRYVDGWPLVGDGTPSTKPQPGPRLPDKSPSWN